jgi:hypothetical protein
VPLRSTPVLVLLFVLAAPAPAQGVVDTTVVVEDPPSTADIRLLRAIYGIEDPAFSAAMRGVNWTSYKVFIATAPTLWLGALALDDEHDYEPAYLLTLSELGTVGVVFALKNVVQRPRPYASLDGVTSRVRRSKEEVTFDPYSFPSGHAATSFAIVTSLSLSYPKWYVIAPSVLYASAVSLSRSWLGVHYPTDTAVGAAIGVGVAFGVHALNELITPAGLKGDSGDSGDSDDPLRAPSDVPLVRVILPF